MAQQFVDSVQRALELANPEVCPVQRGAKADHRGHALRVLVPLSGGIPLHLRVLHAHRDRIESLPRHRPSDAEVEGGRPVHQKCESPTCCHLGMEWQGACSRRGPSIRRSANRRWSSSWQRGRYSRVRRRNGFQERKPAVHNREYVLWYPSFQPFQIAGTFSVGLSLITCVVSCLLEFRTLFVYRSLGKVRRREHAADYQLLRKRFALPAPKSFPSSLRPPRPRRASAPGCVPHVPVHGGQDDFARRVCRDTEDLPLSGRRHFALGIRLLVHYEVIVVATLLTLLRT